MADDPIDALAAANPDLQFGTALFDCGWQLGLAIRVPGATVALYVKKLRLEHQWQIDEQGPPSARQRLADSAMREIPQLKRP